MLKVLKREDLEQTLEILKAFHEESPYPNEDFSERKVTDLFIGLVEDRDYLLLGYFDKDNLVGILVATCHELLFSENKVASELVWFVKPDYRKGTVGVRLYNAFEYWAKNIVNASSLIMAHLGSEKVSSFYTKKGYKKLEESYFKDI